MANRSKSMQEMNLVQSIVIHAEKLQRIFAEIAEIDEKVCDDCAPDHECGEERLLPVVNSPRVGV